MSALDVAMLSGLILDAAAWFGSSKVCAIMGGCDQTLAERDAHPVCRAQAAVIGDGCERPVATSSSMRAASIQRAAAGARYPDSQLAHMDSEKKRA